MDLNKIANSHDMGFQSRYTGAINNVHIVATGGGRVKPRGTYDLNLEFTEIPEGFHPILMTTWSHSVSCNTGAEAPGIAKSFFDLGIGSYKAERTIKFSNGGRLEIKAVSKTDENGIHLDGEVNGNTTLNITPTGLLFYRERLMPAGPGKVVTKAKGVIFSHEGREIRAEVESTYYLDEVDIEMPFEQLRHVTEFGNITGKSYASRLTSLTYKEDDLVV